MWTLCCPRTISRLHRISKQLSSHRPRQRTLQRFRYWVRRAKVKAKATRANQMQRLTRHDRRLEIVGRRRAAPWSLVHFPRSTKAQTNHPFRANVTQNPCPDPSPSPNSSKTLRRPSKRQTLHQRKRELQGTLIQSTTSSPSFPSRRKEASQRTTPTK